MKKLKYVMLPYPADNFTFNKKYEVISSTEAREPHNLAFYILNDKGEKKLCLLNKCAHLEIGRGVKSTFGNWIPFYE